MAIPLGLFIAAPLADVFSLPVVFIGIGVLFLCLGMAALNTRVLIHLEDQSLDTPPVQTLPSTVEEV
jgi:hypothetical protein